MFGIFKKAKKNKKNDENEVVKENESVIENHPIIVNDENDVEEDEDDEFEGEILEYFEDDYQEYWRNEIKRSDWDDGQKLGKILDENKMKEIYGESTKIYMLADGESLLAYCVLSEKNEFDCSYSPWISYVYTSASNRNKGYAKMIIDHACQEAKSNGAEKIYAAAKDNTFVEKMLFSFVDDIKVCDDQIIKIYSKVL